jgi:excisionase family DNA binding protein
MMLTLAEAAERLRLSTRFLREEIYAGRLKAMKAGAGPSSPYRISEENLADYIERQTVQPEGAAS